MPKIAPFDRETNGPFDISEIGLLTPYLDFESLRIAPKPGLTVRADVDEVNNRVVAITLEEDGHRVQLQAFAASKVDGVWEQTLTAIENAISEQGGSAQRVEGALGPEIIAGVPVVEDGQRLLRESRFIGVDGPRWFLRGVLSGPDLAHPPRYQALIDLFRSVGVSRGETPLPPGDLLPLSIPVQQ
jgi:hypothetical protein